MVHLGLSGGRPILARPYSSLIRGTNGNEVASPCPRLAVFSDALQVNQPEFE